MCVCVCVLAQGVASFASEDPDGDEYTDFVEMTEKLVVSVRITSNLTRRLCVCAWLPIVL